MNAIERAAKAILKVRFYDCEPDMYDGLDGFFNELDGELFDGAKSEASAAIASMRDPTDAMKEAADRDNTYYGHVATNKYRAMIDAALKDAE